MTAAVAPNPAPSSARAWLLATRPATLTVAIVPVLVGAAVLHAQRALAPAPVLAALFGAMMIQIGTNLANDVFDYEKGADTEARLGPLRVTQAGLLTPRQVRAGMIACFALATGAGAYLAYLHGWPIVVIGVASIASGIAYTGGPYPLGYNGLGDVFVMLFFGFVAVCGTTFVGSGHVPTVAWLAAVPVGAIATAVLVVNNVRDHETDVHAGKRTLVVRFGRRFGEVEYVALMAAAYAVPIALFATHQARAWVLLPLVTLPLALRLAAKVKNERGAPLNATLAGTAKLLLFFGVLFAAGLALGS